MLKRITSAALASVAAPAMLALLPGSAQANCNLEHLVRSGDTFYSIAERYYGDRQKWSLIY